MTAPAARTLRLARQFLGRDVALVIVTWSRRGVFIPSIEIGIVQREWFPKGKALLWWQGAPLQGARTECGAVASEEKRMPHPKTAWHLHQATNKVPTKMPCGYQRVRLDQLERGRNSDMEARSLHQRDKDIVM